ncbi:hypothetical protein F4811DRAFT_283550 [Daldinia bambusicola]|nr:hypothetical protein F4811DRAFT_283550 [Daldinia bambusicola]
MTRIIQYGLAIEAMLNITGAIPFILYPEWCLSFAITPGPEKITSGIPPSSALLWQVYGALVLALTIPIGLCIPDSKAVAEKRRIVFTTLIAGEVFLEAILLWHVLQADKGGFTLTSLILSAVFLLPALSWHTFAAYIRPHLMESSSKPPTNITKKVH